MARPALVVDASVGVKWFSAKGEASLAAALSIRDSHVAGETRIIVPDLFLYEVTNAMVHKGHIPAHEVETAVHSLFELALEAIPMDAGLMAESVRLARELGITLYDASYVAVARKYGYPLVTANPRHQMERLDCEVIPIDTWPKGT